MHDLDIGAVTLIMTFWDYIYDNLLWKLCGVVEDAVQYFFHYWKFTIERLVYRYFFSFFHVLVNLFIYLFIFECCLYNYLFCFVHNLFRIHMCLYIAMATSYYVYEKCRLKVETDVLRVCDPLPCCNVLAIKYTQRQKLSTTQTFCQCRFSCINYFKWTKHF